MQFGLLFTKKSYAANHAGQNPEDDGIKAERMKSPLFGEEDVDMYTVAAGTPNVYKVTRKETLRAHWCCRMDTGSVVFPPWFIQSVVSC